MFSWLLLAPAPLWAAWYPEALNLAGLTARAERIIVGEVVARQTGRDPQGLFATLYTFRVEQALKGDVTTELTIKQFGVAHHLEDPATGVITFRWPGMPVYETGRRYVLFLHGTSDSGFTSPVGLGSGVFVVRADGQVVNELNNAGLLRDVSLPAPSPRRAGALGAHRRGPIELSALVEATTALAGTSGADRGGAATRTAAPAHQAIAGEGARPRGNVSGLFDGHPIRWNVPTAANPGGTLAAIPYVVETGLLGPVSNAAARAKVAESFAKWTAPATTALVVTNTPGTLNMDVDAVCPSPTCYQNWAFVFGDGLSPVIFDTDGSIVLALTGNRCSFFGFGGAQGQTADGGLTWTLEGTVILNGAWLDTGGIPGSVCGGLFSPSLDDFGVAITHEIGHFLGLDHSIVNSELRMAGEPFLTFGVPPCSALELMAPVGVVFCSPDALHADDVGMVSSLYPSAAFASTVGALKGRLFAPNGVTPVNCGNIVVRNVKNPFMDAVAAITGISEDIGTPPAGQAGSYQVAGLTPGASYLVGVTQIPSFATGGSNLTELCDPVTPLPGPEEFYSGASESGDPAVDNPNCFAYVTAGLLTTGIDIVLNSAGASNAACRAFLDAPPDHPTFTWITALVNAGITTGCSGNPPLYCPGAPVTRGQMSVFLLRGIHGGGYQPPAATGDAFDDVPLSHSFVRWIEQLAVEGVTGGCSTTPPLYCPEATVTRGQMSVFLLRAKHGPAYQPPAATGMFEDVAIDHPFAKWIEQLAREGVTTGCSMTPALYCPGAPVTRGQMAVFLVRTFNLPM
jgi:hypothetical protein